LTKGSIDSAGLRTLKTKNQDAFFGRPIADCSATLARKVRQASALQPRPELSMQNPIGDAAHCAESQVALSPNFGATPFPTKKEGKIGHEHSPDTCTHFARTDPHPRPSKQTRQWWLFSKLVRALKTIKEECEHLRQYIGMLTELNRLVEEDNVLG
jgi:hypothetical protein